MSLPSDLETARAAPPRPILEVARDLGLRDDEVEPYGFTKAKIGLAAIERLEAARPRGRYVVATAPPAAAVAATHIPHGNPLGIDALNVLWPRAVDISDRALRKVVVGLGGRANGYPRETEFVITVASEVMAALALASDLRDLRGRLGRGGPAFVHCGPFANIAHGNNSVLADRIALATNEIVCTEAGFGADMGAEKFFDIKCRASGLRPGAAVVARPLPALKLH